MPKVPVRGTRIAIAAALVLTGGAVAIAGTHGPASTGTPTFMPGQLTAVRVVNRRPPVIRITVPGVGRILATTRHMALYTYLPERADHTVHCVGACAVAWPPLRIARGVRIARRARGLTGVFGTVRRPNGAVQLTRNGLPLYSFSSDAPGTVTGNGVGGFTVVRG
jgi:predicted lipoprotein with Yx(FWY)xxD motif